jgi:hypothetical protein
MVAAMTDLSIGRASEGGHWYGRDGSCVYEMRGANGKMRPVTLRDARKLGLVPGFSSIAAMEAKPQLERWKVEQALMAALTLPRKEGETDSDFMTRAREDSWEQARKAAERGTWIHAAIQGYFEGKPVPVQDLPFVLPVRDWLYGNFGTEYWVAERSFAHPLGYGGKIDLSNAVYRATIDLKCKDFSADKTEDDLAWPEMCMQLTSYSHGISVADATKINIFVSTSVPGLIRTKVWTLDEERTAWEAFKCLLRLWQLRKNYDSSFATEQVAA